MTLLVEYVRGVAFAALGLVGAEAYQIIAARIYLALGSIYYRSIPRVQQQASLKVRPVPLSLESLVVGHYNQRLHALGVVRVSSAMNRKPLKRRSEEHTSELQSR